MNLSFCYFIVALMTEQLEGQMDGCTDGWSDVVTDIHFLWQFSISLQYQKIFSHTMPFLQHKILILGAEWNKSHLNTLKPPKTSPPYVDHLVWTDIQTGRQKDRLTDRP